MAKHDFWFRLQVVQSYLAGGQDYAGVAKEHSLDRAIPAFVPSAKGGARKLAVSNEAALNGILFVLQTGIPWEDLPNLLGTAAA